MRTSSRATSMSLLFSSARLIASFSDNGNVSVPTPKRLRLGTGGKGRGWNCGITGSRKGSCGAVGTGSPVEGVGAGVCAGIDPGGAAGFVCGAPGGAAGFGVGVVPGIGCCPGGLLGSPAGGVGRGVDCGTCASAALVPLNRMHARTAGLSKVRDIELNIRRRAP